MERIIAAILSNIFVPLFIIAVIVAMVKMRSLQSRSEKFDVFLAELVFYGVGLGGIWAFIAHAIGTAAHIGWAPSPFEWELAFITLGVAVIAVAQLWTGRPYRVATAIITIIFFWGCAVQHVNQIMCCRNYAPGNAALVLYWDIIFPLILLVALIASRPKASATLQSRSSA
ncbi:MAG: hypothetical protein JOZ97_03780 [Candidatus Eremiobacteraeota bacterium]|nr:hypothetical protein [Candidatus Eremiobacteraeota bacterium]